MDGRDEDSGLFSMQEMSRQVNGSNPAYNNSKPDWFHVRVFYVRLSCCTLDDGLSPQYLTLRLLPKNPETNAVEINGGRLVLGKKKFASVCLKRNRIDNECEEATFVNRDNVRTAGTLQFQVCDEDDVLICGSLEFLEGFNRVWGMDCYSAAGVANCGLLGGRKFASPPAVEVYVAGSFCGSPVILTKIVQLICRRKTARRGSISLDAIPEFETTEKIVDSNVQNDQVPKDTDYEELDENDKDSVNFYSGGGYVEGDDTELSWFNAGVRVGVGIGLGMCLGVGIGIGLLVRTYQATTTNFRKRLF